jgi:MYXO-CTERM domain-containing protein
MSNIISGTPKETLSASDLSNEAGGYCGTKLPMGWGVLALGSFALIRRRRHGLAVLTLGLMMTSSLDANASALFTSEDAPVLRQSMDLRYGPINFESDAINSVFTVNSHQMLYADLGWSVWNIFEATAGVGFFQEMGWLLSEDGEQSSEHDMLTIYPLSLSGTFRFDILKEQFLVPFGSYGVDYWVFKENWATNSGEAKVNGGKNGTHYAYGVQILLDKLDPASASKLEVRTKIRDTYLSVERRQLSFDTDGLDFTSESTTVGLRFHY